MHVPASAPTGEAFAVPRLAEAGAHRTTGTFTYAQRARGRFPPDFAIADRRLEGTVDVVRRIHAPEGGAASRTVVVEGTVSTTDAVGKAEPVRASASLRLEFPEAARGGADHKTIVVRTRDGLADLLENVLALWTEPLPAPARPLRVGELWEADDGPDLEPMKRSAWMVFRARDPRRAETLVPIRGAGWVSSREGDDVLLRLRLWQAATGSLERPGDPSRSVTYAAALHRDRRVALTTGVTRVYESTLRTRIRYQETGVDYTVDVEQRASLTTVPAE